MDWVSVRSEHIQTAQGTYGKSDLFGAIVLGFKRKKNEIESGIRGGQQSGRTTMQFSVGFT